MKYTYTVLDSWWWTEKLSETCRVLFQNKFEKLVHLVGFIIRIYHDARSSECQILSTCPWLCQYCTWRSNVERRGFRHCLAWGGKVVETCDPECVSDSAQLVFLLKIKKDHFFPWPRHEIVRNVRGLLPLILVSALDGGQWSNSRPGLFVPMKVPWYPLKRGSGGFQSRSGCFGEQQNVLHKTGIYVKPVCSAWNLVNMLTTLFNVAPCMLPHLLYNPTHALFTL